MTYVAIALLAIAVLAAAWYAVRAMRAAPSLAIGRITRVTSEPGLELDPALSPDGQTIAYAAGAAGRMRIYVRPLTGGRIVPLMDESSLRANDGRSGRLTARASCSRPADRRCRRASRRAAACCI